MLQAISMQKKPHAKLARAAKTQAANVVRSPVLHSVLGECFSVRFPPEPLRPWRTLREVLGFDCISYGEEGKSFYLVLAARVGIGFRTCNKTGSEVWRPA